MKNQPYNLFKKNIILSLFLCSNLFCSYPDGKATYQELNKDPNNPFVLSIGTSMSQTKHLANTVHPTFIRKKLQELIKNLSTTKAANWLKNKNRYWFTLNSLPTYICKNGDFIDPITIGRDKNSIETEMLFTNLAENKSADQLTLTKCPCCEAEIIQETKRKDPIFTQNHENALLEQLQYLGVHDQKGIINKKRLPNYRLSLEATDILKPNSMEIDQKKLKNQASFLQELGNPMLFMHHYSNPLVKPNLFEDPADIEWFGNYCESILKNSPQITHVCPISQPIAFGFRPERQELPPFECNIKQAQFLKNLTDAQILAAQKMKSVRDTMQKDSPKLNVLLSHQWKLMKPKHSNPYDPRNTLERGIAQIANMIYNQRFVNLVTPHLDDFDGIALSVYPPVYFNLGIPEADNCSGVIDEASTLETIQEAHKAFPTKDIYIVETGCNTVDPQAKKDFINMTLKVCKIAREQGIPVQGVYFWGHTNDPEFYCEWNAAPGSTHFAPFDKLDINNPTESINAAGIHIKNVLAK